MPETLESNEFREFDLLFQHRNVENSATHLIPHIKQDSGILDLGCGIGSITLDLGQKTKNAVLGIDQSTESIKKAQTRAHSEGASNVIFEVGNATDLSAYQSDSFDIVHAHQLCLHLSDPVAALREMRRVVKPGGVVAIRDLAYTLIVPSSPAFEKIMANMGEAHRQRGANLEAGQVSHIWMHEAGFPRDRIEKGSAGWEWSTLEQRRAYAAAIWEYAKTLVDDEAHQAQLEQELKDWQKNSEARVMGLDGWIVAIK